MMGPLAMISGGFLGGLLILMAVLYFFPAYYLFKFASKTNDAFNNNNTEYLASAFENLKSHYKFIGIMTIIMIVFYLFFFIIAAIAGVSAAASM